VTARRMPGPGHKDNTRFVFNNTVTAIYVPSKVIYTMFRVNTRSGGVEGACTCGGAIVWACLGAASVATTLRFPSTIPGNASRTGREGKSEREGSDAKMEGRFSRTFLK
jgi:hypothetical protein